MLVILINMKIGERAVELNTGATMAALLRCNSEPEAQHMRAMSMAVDESCAIVPNVAAILA